MGMFDTVRVHSPLLDPALHDVAFQTKDLICKMDTYTITAKGRLIHTPTIWEGVPDEERPYWGKPEWNDKMFQAFGSLKVIPLPDVDTHYHGDLEFYGYDSKKTFHEYRAHFIEGRLMWIEERPPPEDTAPEVRADPA